MKKNSFIVPSLLLASSLGASSLSFDGNSGLLNTQDARINEDFTGKVFFIKDEDEKKIGLNFSILPYVELSSLILDNDSKKENLINLKVNIKKEGDFSPALTYGLQDIWGESKYSNKYISLSKKIGYFDTTLGYIKGRQTGDIKYTDKNSIDYLLKSSWSDGDFYIGTRFLYRDNLSFMLDYKDSSTHFGFDYNIYKNLNILAFINNDKEFSYAISYDFDLKKKRDRFKNKVSYSFDNQNTESIINNKTKSSVYDLKNLNKTIEDLSKKEDIQESYITYKSYDKTIRLNKKEYDLFQADKLSNTYMKDSLVIKRELNKKSSSIIDYNFQTNLKIYKNTDEKDALIYSSVDANINFDVKNMFKIKASFELPIYNEIDNNINDSYLEYEKNKDLNLNKTYLSYENDFSNNNYLNIDFGYLDKKFAGLSLEYQKIYDDKFAFSLQYQGIYNRESDDILAYDDKYKDAKFLNIYYLFSKHKKTHLGLKIGEFLEDDKGFRVDLARTFNTYKIGAYYSYSNEDNLTNKKGIYLSIPFGYGISKSINHANVEVLSSPNKKSQYVDFDNSLYNKLSNENNINILKENIINLYNKIN